jgi:hypothetical protein
MADTALFEGGKPKLVVKTDPRDGCMIRYKKTPTLSELRKIFTAVSRERKKEHGPFEKPIEARTAENAYQKEQENRQAYLQFFDANNPPPPMRQQRDAMIFRFKPDQSLAVELDHNTVDTKPIQVTKVLSEFEFINEFKRPPGHPYWSTIDHM